MKKRRADRRAQHQQQRHELPPRQQPHRAPPPPPPPPPPPKMFRTSPTSATPTQKFFRVLFRNVKNTTEAPKNNTMKKAFSSVDLLGISGNSKSEIYAPETLPRASGARRKVKVNNTSMANTSYQDPEGGGGSPPNRPPLSSRALLDREGEELDLLMQQHHRKSQKRREENNRLRRREEEEEDRSRNWSQALNP